MHAHLNPLPGDLCYLIFHPLEVVGRGAHICPTKVDPRTVRVQIFLIIVDP